MRERRRYIIVSGHSLPEYESVVENRDTHQVVEKRDGAAAEPAEKTDPRS